MRASVLTLCLTMAILALGGCSSRAGEFTTEDESTVRAMFDSTVANIRADDWNAWSRRFAENAVLYPPNAKPVIGRAALLAWGEAFPSVEELSFSDVQVVGVGDVAYGTSAYVLKLQGSQPDTGKQLVVFRRAPGERWEIPAVAFNSNLAQPASPLSAGSPRD